MIKVATTVLLVLALSACTRDEVAASLLGGAKNWCRHSNGVCYVSGK